MLPRCFARACVRVRVCVCVLVSVVRARVRVHVVFLLVYPLRFLFFLAFLLSFFDP